MNSAASSAADPAARWTGADMQRRVAKRYARALNLNPRDFSAAVLASAGAGSAATTSAPLAA